MSIALVGNPNCGKTTLFNALTGSRQYVGNWPGVTVEKKAGRCRFTGEEIIDLPGAYSLSPYSMEEAVTRDYLLTQKPELIINIVDGTNLERNLYLTFQLLTLPIPLVLAVNMMDEMNKKGFSLDVKALSAALGVPVVEICARRGEGLEALLRAGKQAVREYRGPVGPEGLYDAPTSQAVREIEGLLTGEIFPKGFLAVKLLEGDKFCEEQAGLPASQAKRLSRIRREYERTSPYGDAGTMVADARYKRITAITQKALKKPERVKWTASQLIDRAALGRLTAIPLFLLLLLGMFALTFGPVGEGCKSLLERGVLEPLIAGLQGMLATFNVPEWCYSLLLDGVAQGVGSILSFLPQITILFLCLSLLEDSGYMARAAFVMDRVMRKLGLSGKSFIPMLMGFGCTTSAVMAARTMENEKDRRLTVMLTPFMSCGARLPIYALFAGVFFESHQGLVVASLYLLGILAAVVSGILLKKTLFRGGEAPFVMELPPYRLPSFPVIGRHVWEKVKGFLGKAGTVIVSMSVLIWFLEHFDGRFAPVENPADSLLAAIGKGAAPLFSPLGFGFWQAAVALIAGLVAKESVVAALAMLYGGAGASLAAGLAGAFTPLAAYSFLAFVLLYMPCIAAFLSIKREMNSLWWALGTVLFQFVTAYGVSFCIYQIGSLFVR